MSILLADIENNRFFNLKCVIFLNIKFKISNFDNLIVFINVRLELKNVVWRLGYVF